MNIAITKPVACHTATTDNAKMARSGRTIQSNRALSQPIPCNQASMPVSGDSSQRQTVPETIQLNASGYR